MTVMTRLSSRASLLDVFQHIYVINLPVRRDRRRDMGRELSRIGIAPEDERVTFFPGVRPDDEAGFPTIGARGCFLSHLDVLKDAHRHGFERFLVAEDDLSFVKDFDNRVGEVVRVLRTRDDWDMFYGGYRTEFYLRDRGGMPLVPLPATAAVVTAHMLGLRGDVAAKLISFLETVLSRPAGHPDGGPMHVDGAYSTFRAQSPDIVTLAAVPALGFQRSSRSDISPEWYDRTPVLMAGVSLLRQLNNLSKH